MLTKCAFCVRSATACALGDNRQLSRMPWFQHPLASKLLRFPEVRVMHDLARVWGAGGRVPNLTPEAMRFRNTQLNRTASGRLVVAVEQLSPLSSHSIE